MQYKTKFNVNDRVWLISNNRLTLETIESVYIYDKTSGCQIKYFLEGLRDGILEEELFATRDELIENLIEQSKTQK